MTSAHVPLGCPVSAIVHAWQVPLQAVLQQTPSAQSPLAHAPPLVQAVPFESPTQVPPVHSPLVQSAATSQSFPFAHVLPSMSHSEPPQSTPVSPPSWMPSAQWEATQVPVPLQTTPPPSVHGVPSGASVSPHAWSLHAGAAQTVVEAGQSVGATQATQTPSPSHTLPPSSSHVVSAGALVTLHACAAQFATWQTVFGVGQSLESLHATQLPASSQTVPPPLLHAVPFGACDVPHLPAAVQVAGVQLEVGAGQSVAGSVHCEPASCSVAEVPAVPELPEVPDVPELPPLPDVAELPALPERAEPPELLVPRPPSCRPASPWGDVASPSPASIGAIAIVSAPLHASTMKQGTDAAASFDRKRIRAVY